MKTAPAFVSAARLLATVAALVAAAAPSGAEGVPVSIVRPVDGDTVVLRLGGEAVRVRLLGADAPELGRNGRRDEPFAREALRFVRASLREARAVELEVAGDRVDDYGRTLGFVWVQPPPPAQPLNLSEELLRRGLARAVRRYLYPGKERFLALEGEARRARRGLWRR